MRPLNARRARGRPGGGNRRPHNAANRNYDSNGPNVRIRGTASQIFDKYCTLARDANAAGDRIAAENYLQHAEHYFRIISANGSGQRGSQQQGAGDPRQDLSDDVLQPVPGTGPQPTISPEEAKDNGNGSLAQSGSDSPEVEPAKQLTD